MIYGKLLFKRYVSNRVSIKKKKQIESQVTDKGDRKQQLLVWINLERKIGTPFYLTTGIKKKMVKTQAGKFIGEVRNLRKHLPK